MLIVSFLFVGYSFIRSLEQSACCRTALVSVSLVGTIVLKRAMHAHRNPET